MVLMNQNCPKEILKRLIDGNVQSLGDSVNRQLQEIGAEKLKKISQN